MFPTSPVVAVAGTASAVTAWLAASGWRRRDRPGGAWFAALMLAAAVWSGLDAVGLAVTGTGPLRLALGRATFVGVLAVPVAYLAFAATRAGRWTDPGRTRRRVAALSVLPAVALVGALTNPLHRLFLAAPTVVVADRLGPLSTVAYAYGPLYLPAGVYGAALGLAGAVLLLRTALAADDGDAERTLAFATGAVLPPVGWGLSVAGVVPVVGLDPGPVALALAGLALSRGLVSTDTDGRRLDRATVFEHVSEGVVVVEDGTVTDVNGVAESLLGRERERLVGRPVERALAPVVEAADDPVAGVADLDGVAVEVADACVEVRVASPSSRPASGHVLTLRDVTDRRTREQRLQVMNRLLRHNFRNEMTVVHGFAELLDDRLDGREGEMAARAHEVASELVERVEKAAGLERIADRAEVEPDAVDLPLLARGLVEELQGVYEEVDFEVAPGGTEPLLACVVYENAETVLRNLLENAVEHHDGDAPTVRVTVRRVEETVEVAVADDGPGLPEHERAVLEAGRETDLEHGSGVGLWLVHWGVTAADGEISFEDNDPRGTVVRVRLPAVADPDATDLAMRPGEADPVSSALARADDERPTSATGDGVQAPSDPRR